MTFTMDSSAEESLSELSFDEIELRRRALESLRKPIGAVYSVNKRTGNVTNSEVIAREECEFETVSKGAQDLEVELRKRALLSLKKRQGNVRHSSSVPTLTNGTTQSEESVFNFEKERFVISVRTHPNASTSSSSEDECDFESLPSVTIGSHSVNSSVSSSVNTKLPPQASSSNFVRQVQTSNEVTLPKPNKPPVKTAVWTSPPKKMPSLSSLHKALLKHGRRREELEGKLQEREKQLLVKKRLTIMLQTSMVKLKNRMEALQRQYVKCQKEVTQMSKEKKAIASQLEFAKKKQEKLCTVIMHQSKKRKVRKSNPTYSADFDQIVDYCNSMFDILRTTSRIHSPFFQYYNLFAISKRMFDEVEMSSGCNESFGTKLMQPSGFDPGTPICPYFLNGNCSDVTCIFQHPGESVTSTHKSFRTLVELEENLYHFTDSQCPVCGFVFESAEEYNLPVACLSVSDWHSVFSKCEDWSPFLKSTIRTDSVFLLKHHLYAVLTISEDAVISACDFLQDVNFQTDLLSFALNYREFLLADRKRLLRECLSRLLLQAQDLNISSAICCMNGLLSVVYHISRFEYEVYGTRHFISLIENLLSVDPNSQISLPIVHPARWGIWFLRMLIAVSTHFPTSPTHCPFVEPAKLFSNRAIFEAAAVDMRLSCNNLSIFISQCSEASIPLTSVSPVISFCHLYAQFLATKGDAQQGVIHCLNLLQNSKLLQISDNLLLPTAIHLANSGIPENHSHAFRLISDVTDKLSMKTCFTYCLAFSIVDHGNWESCGHVLTNHLSSFFSIQLPDATSVYSAFRQILCTSQHPPIKTRNVVYLWMCFGLFSLIHNFSTGLLPDFLNHVVARLENFQGYDSSLHCPLISLLMHLGLSMANLLPSSESYLDALNKLLFPSYLVSDADFCSCPPSWFLELLQFIRVDKFSSSKSPGSLFARIVEIYGFRCLKSLVTIDESFKNESLEWLQSVCSIARLEKPTDEEFWLLIASLGVKFHPKSADDGRGCVLYLNECLSDAVEALPLSSRLWRLYAVLVKNCGLGDCQMEMLRQRVARISPDMVLVVEEVLSKKTAAEVFLLLNKPLVEPLACADYNEFLKQFCVRG